ncbi:MAG: transporter [Flavobacteriales bacterium CG_4_9_14_3_um_filter_40_17]|nr:MAG: transporter [Flavobacteriales bacterium CG_4_9_14_3_um_filter_40_17]
MKLIKFLFIGIGFGIILVKAEIVSWYRIIEMFRFESFHMYGVIGLAVVLGVIALQIIKRKNLKDYEGNPIVIEPKPKQYTRNLIGGIIFGLGWALIGACPGPLFVLAGFGYVSILIVIVAAVLGAFLKGILVK